jgi:hypothetical protein
MRVSTAAGAAARNGSAWTAATASQITCSSRSISAPDEPPSDW